ncbi:MAG: universal stress protein, partial [Methanomicrobiales archaeon]|nr:universal stress protein [Methanomicrobiales archaeon]
DGLMHLYREGLARAGILAESMGVMLGTDVLTGKVYSEVVRYAAEHNAGLVIVGRHGLHHSDESLIGSNTLNIARFGDTNILIVAAPTTSVQLAPAMGEDAPAIPWTPEAEVLLSRMPSFAAPVARKAITLHARSAGYTEVTPAIMREVSGRLKGKQKHSKKG